MSQIKPQQLSLPYPPDVSPPSFSLRDGIEECSKVHNGAVYTRPWVVKFMLDLSGYDSDKNLVDMVAVEPSCGTGEFLEHMIRRLSASCRRQGRPLRDCAKSLRALELDPGSVSATRERAESALLDSGWDTAEAQELSHGWVRRADFLLDQELGLTEFDEGVDFVIGNPPYIRLESIRAEVASAYRRLFRTMTGRADIYVGFYERALNLLKPGGLCGFICADRWMLNQYGKHLRKLVTDDFAVEAVVEMHSAGAFHDDVLAYPAITVIRRAKQGKALVARVDQASDDFTLEELTQAMHGIRKKTHGGEQPCASEANSVVVDEWFTDSDPWPCVSSPERLKLLKHLEATFPPLEDPLTGTKVGIGVATGADKAFITDDPELVERDRLLPLVLAKDTMTGALQWSGHYLVNPWEADGSLVDLGRYPQLRQYFEENEEALKSRNVGKRNPTRWFKTIDKVNYALTAKPKLLIPDIKDVAHPVYDRGGVYPHHNLYYVISDLWDLKVLGGILLSRVGQFFIECYSVRMHSGYLRFQAQYLRRIRVPHPSEIIPEHAEGLRRAFDKRDVEAATSITLQLYGIEDGVPE